MIQLHRQTVLSDARSRSHRVPRVRVGAAATEHCLCATPLGIGIFAVFVAGVTYFLIAVKV
jgi:hypothetical protein